MQEVDPQKGRDSGRDARIDRRILFVLTLTAAAYYASYASRFEFNLHDEGYLYYLAARIADGARPYHDFELVSYFPGPFWLTSLIFDGAGPSVWAARLFQAFTLAFAPGTSFMVFRRFTTRSKAFLFSCVALLVPGPWHKSYVALLWAVLLLTSLRAFEAPVRSRVFVLGLTIGVAFGLRIDVAVTGLAMVLAIAVLGRLRPSNAPSFALGTFLGVSPFAFFLWQRGASGAYLEQLVRFPAAIAKKVFLDEKLLPPAPASLFIAGDHALPAWLFHAGLVAILLFAVQVVRSSHAPRKVELWLALIWVLFQVPQFAIERPDISHLTQHTGALLLALLVVASAGASVGERARAARALARLGRVAITVYLLLFVVHCIADGQGGARRWSAADVQWHRLSNGLEFPTRPERGVGELVEYMLANTSEGDPVASWPYYPGANFLAERRMPGRRVFVTPATIREEIELELIRDLETEDVRVVLYLSEFSLHARESSLPSSFMPTLDAYLAARFSEAARYDGVSVLRPRSSIAAPAR